MSSRTFLAISNTGFLFLFRTFWENTLRHNTTQWMNTLHPWVCVQELHLCLTSTETLQRTCPEERRWSPSAETDTTPDLQNSPNTNTTQHNVSHTHLQRWKSCVCVCVQASPVNPNSEDLMPHDPTNNDTTHPTRSLSTTDSCDTQQTDTIREESQSFIIRCPTHVNTCWWRCNWAHSENHILPSKPKRWRIPAGED